MMKKYIAPSLLISVLATPAIAQTYQCEIDGKTKSVGMPCDQYRKLFSRDNEALIVQKAVPKQESINIEKTHDVAAEEPATEKSWLEKRAEERALKKEQRKKDHDSRVQAANDNARFEKLIWDKQVGVGMSEAQVRKALGKPSHTKSGEDEKGNFEKWTFNRYKNRLYVGKQIVEFRNGKVISIEQ